MFEDVAARLIASEGLRAIRNYRGNLAAVTEAIAKGWIPRGDEPDVAAHLATLRNHLATAGSTEADPFLLRYALIVPGMLRGSVLPFSTLDRSGFSSRRQRESADQVERLSDALCLGRAFLPDLEPDAERALVRLAATIEGVPAVDSAGRLAAYRGLSVGRARDVAVIAVGLLDDSSPAVAKVGADALRFLAGFRFEPLDPKILRTLLERRIFHPPLPYRDAGEETARALLAMLDAPDADVRVDHVVRCLAWTRAEVATAAFRSWADRLPGWAANLLVPPGYYPSDAGWRIDARGRRVDLLSRHCRRLVPADGGSSGVVPCRVPSSEACPRCRSPLIVLFDFGAVADELPAGAPRVVAGCHYCSMYGPTFTAHDRDGSWRWLAGPDDAPAREPEPPSGNRFLVLDDDSVPPFASSLLLEMGEATLLGGAPAWQQDEEYPRCPECGELMTHLAQHDNGGVGEEGTHYAFFCVACHVTALVYQQT